MKTQAELQTALEAQDAKLDEVAVDLVKLALDLAADIADLKAQIAAGGTPVDLQTQFDKLTANTTKLSAIADAILAQDAGVLPVVPPVAA